MPKRPYGTALNKKVKRKKITKTKRPLSRMKTTKADIPADRSVSPKTKNA